MVRLRKYARIYVTHASVVRKHNYARIYVTHASVVRKHNYARIIHKGTWARMVSCIEYDFLSTHRVLEPFCYIDTRTKVNNQETNQIIGQQ